MRFGRCKRVMSSALIRRAVCRIATIPIPELSPRPLGYRVKARGKGGDGTQLTCDPVGDRDVRCTTQILKEPVCVALSQTRLRAAGV